MTELLPLLAGAGPVASLLIGMIAAYKLTEAARREAVDRYRLTAEEADQKYEDASTRLGKVETTLDQMRQEFTECVAKLGKAIAELEMSKIRERRLADRIDHLEAMANDHHEPKEQADATH